MHYSTRKSSTSKIKVEFGGMTPGWPLEPYAKSGEQVNFALSPTHIWKKKSFTIKLFIFLSSSANSSQLLNKGTSPNVYHITWFSACCIAFHHYFSWRMSTTEHRPPQMIFKLPSGHKVYPSVSGDPSYVHLVRAVPLNPILINL